MFSLSNLGPVWLGISVHQIMQYIVYFFGQIRYYACLVSNLLPAEIETIHLKLGAMSFCSSTMSFIF
jgi:hypothetical protein